MKELVFLLPEIYLVITALALVVNEVSYHGEHVRVLHATALLGIAGALLQVFVNYTFVPELYLQSLLVHDAFTLFFQIIFLLAAGITVYASKKSQEIYIENRSEFCAMVLGISALLMLAASSAHLLLTFCSLQGALVLGYLLIAQKKQSHHATSAAVKKMGMATLFLLFVGFGTLILFATTKTLHIYDIHKLMMTAELPDKTLTVAFTLLFLGIGAQMCLFPNHLWGADAYEGASTAASGFLSVVLRASGFAVLLRLVIVIFSKNSEFPGVWTPATPFDWRWMIASVSGLSLISGALLAYSQVHARKLFASLIVTQTGFLMLGLLTLDEVGFSSLLFNIAAEVFAVLGAYAALSYFIDRVESDRFENLNGAVARSVPEGLCLIFFLLSWVGLPPFPGFIGKVTLISAAVRHGWNIVAIVAVFSSLLCTMAMARFIFQLMSDFKKDAVPLIPNGGHRVMLLALMVPLLLMSVFSEWLLQFAGQSVQLIFW